MRGKLGRWGFGEFFWGGLRKIKSGLDWFWGSKVGGRGFLWRVFWRKSGIDYVKDGREEAFGERGADFLRVFWRDFWGWLEGHYGGQPFWWHDFLWLIGLWVFYFYYLPSQKISQLLLSTSLLWRKKVQTSGNPFLKMC